MDKYSTIIQTLILVLVAFIAYRIESGTVSFDEKQLANAVVQTVAEIGRTAPSAFD